MRATASSMPCVGRQSVRARHQDAGVLGRLDGRADLHARFLARQARLAGGREFARRDLVLDEHRGGAGATIGPHHALDVHRIAVAVIAVGQHEQVGRGAVHHVEGIEHLAERDEIEIRAAQAACGDARAREESRLEALAVSQLGGEPIPYRRHDDEAGFGQQGAQTLGGSGHRHLLGMNFRGGR